MALLFLLCDVRSVWAENVSYAVSINGVEDKALQGALENKSLLFKLVDRVPETTAALDRRIKNDLVAFKEVMKEYGYYDAALTQNTYEENGKRQIVISVDTGSLYTIKEFTVHWPDKNPPDIAALQALKLPVGETALPGIILDTEQEILTILMQNGYPFPQTSGRKLFVHHENKSVTVGLFLDPGNVAHFGSVTITGLKRLEKPFVDRRIRWQEGEIFNIKKIAVTRKALIDSGVIANVDSQYNAVVKEEKIPVTLDIKESKHRSIGAGVAYSTILGPTGNVFWEHRNLFGQAEKLRIKAEGGAATYALGADLIKPDLWSNQDLSWQNSIDFRQDFLEAYDKNSALASTVLNYKYSDTSAVSGGVALEYSRIQEESEPDKDFTLLSFPVTYSFDSTDDFLDPREGLRFNVGFIPYQVLNGQNSFVKTESKISHYLPFGERFVWANWGRASVINGQTLEDIPADKRLYAGGSGSVRGYGYQLLGPLDENNNPIGGRMAFGAGTEGRFKITDTIEAVAFYEGGRVSGDLEFGGHEPFLWGAGSGVRYHTAIGSLRADIAVPLDKREPDHAFQFYISLGQAF